MDGQGKEVQKKGKIMRNKALGVGGRERGNHSTKESKYLESGDMEEQEEDASQKKKDDTTYSTTDGQTGGEKGIKECAARSGKITGGSQEDGKMSNKDKTVERRMSWRFPKYSAGALRFYMEAVEMGHTSQTHFTDPAADYCY